MKNKRMYPHKKFTTAKKYGDNSLEEKKESLLVKVYVSAIMLALTFAIASLNNPKAEELQITLKTAISQSITAQQARQISQKGIKKLMSFKENGITKKVEDTVEEVFLPEDASKVN